MDIVEMFQSLCIDSADFKTYCINILPILKESQIDVLLEDLHIKYDKSINKTDKINILSRIVETNAIKNLDDICVGILMYHRSN